MAGCAQVRDEDTFRWAADMEVKPVAPWIEHPDISLQMTLLANAVSLAREQFGWIDDGTGNGIPEVRG